MMFNLNATQREYLQKELQSEQALIDAIRSKLPDLEELVFPFTVDYEDGVYRLYHHSFKVYYLQDLTLKAVDIFESIGKATNTTLCKWFQEIVADGTGKQWKPDHNRDWLLHTRPIVEAFLHAKYFLDLMIKYGQELDSPPTILPFGWAAILELYNLR